jgi:hypothetical protein
MNPPETMTIDEALNLLGPPTNLMQERAQKNPSLDSLIKEETVHEKNSVDPISPREK